MQHSSSSAEHPDERWWLSALIVTIGLFYGLTLRTGHNWGDDFAMFIHHAKNIVEGKPYADTGYVFNPYHPGFGPNAYPPVFPLLIAPVYRWLGVNLEAMKMEAIPFLLVSLIFWYKVFRKSLSVSWSLLVVALIGLHPEVWDFKDNVLVDFYFLFFLSASFYMIQALREDHSLAHQWSHGCLLGFFFYLACGTKTLGIALVISLILGDIWQWKKPKVGHITALLVCTGLLGIQYLILGTDSRLQQDALTTFHSTYQNLIWYTEEFCALWHNGYSKTITVGLFGVLSLFVLKGYVYSVKKGITALELFPWIYMLPVLLYPWSGAFRLIMPLLPLYCFYMVLGMQHTRVKDSYRWAYPVLFGAIFCTYISRYTSLPWGPYEGGVTAPEAVQLFTYVRDHTAQNDLVVCLKPRAIALFTGRRATVYHESTPAAPLWKFLRDSQANYLLETHDDAPHYRRFIQDHSRDLILIFSNIDFKLWKIRAL